MEGILGKITKAFDQCRLKGNLVLGAKMPLVLAHGVQTVYSTHSVPVQLHCFNL